MTERWTEEEIAAAHRAYEREGACFGAALTAADELRDKRRAACDDETERLAPLTPEGERLLREAGFRTDVAEVELRRLEERAEWVGASGDAAWLLSTCRAAMDRVRRLEGFVGELAEEDCTYGDECPSFGVRHGRCLRCKAKAALAEREGGEVG